MRRAIDISIENVKNNTGGPFGTVIVKNGEIIAEGSNLVTSTNDPTAHGEVVAIRKACEKLNTFELKGCELYTSCEPCPMCLAATYWARIDHLFFACDRVDAANGGFDDEFLYKELVTSISKRTIPTEQIMQTEGNVAFEVWSKSESKIMY